jgi:hypothetical protein
MNAAGDGRWSNGRGLQFQAAVVQENVISQPDVGDDIRVGEGDLPGGIVDGS